MFAMTLFCRGLQGLSFMRLASQKLALIRVKSFVIRGITRALNQVIE